MQRMSAWGIFTSIQFLGNRFANQPLNLETHNHGIWDSDSRQPQRKYVVFFFPLWCLGFQGNDRMWMLHRQQICLALFFVVVFDSSGRFLLSAHLFCFSDCLQVIPPIGLLWASKWELVCVGLETWDAPDNRQNDKMLVGMLALFFLHHWRITEVHPEVASLTCVIFEKDFCSFGCMWSSFTTFRRDLSKQLLHYLLLLLPLLFFACCLYFLTLCKCDVL